MLQPSSLLPTPQVCLKGDDCKYLHSDEAVPGFNYERPRPKGRGRGNKKVRARGGQVFSALVAATALSLGASLPTQAQAEAVDGGLANGGISDHSFSFEQPTTRSLTDDVTGSYGQARSLTGQQQDDVAPVRSAGQGPDRTDATCREGSRCYENSCKTGDTICGGIGQIWFSENGGLGYGASGQASTSIKTRNFEGRVDYACAEFKYIDAEGSGFPVCQHVSEAAKAKTEGRSTTKKSWTIEELQAHVSTPEQVQATANAVIHESRKQEREP